MQVDDGNRVGRDPNRLQPGSRASLGSCPLTLPPVPVAGLGVDAVVQATTEATPEVVVAAVVPVVAVLVVVLLLMVVRLAVAELLLLRVHAVHSRRPPAAALASA